MTKPTGPTKAQMSGKVATISDNQIREICPIRSWKSQECEEILFWHDVSDIHMYAVGERLNEDN